MFKQRTDLAFEARELWNESAGQKTKLSGVEARDYVRQGCQVTAVRILNDKGAEAIGKPVGNYVTVEISGFSSREEDGFGRVCRAVSEELRQMLRLPDGGTVLAVGLGNTRITPDAVGPKAIENTMVTRHLVENIPEYFGGFRQVAAITPGVLGTTGVESMEIIRGVAEKVKPEMIIVVDALASRRMSRLCNTVQLADTGIVPGSGVGNSRSALNRDTMGIPVIAIGVPTVVDAATLAIDMMNESGISAGHNEAAIFDRAVSLIVTPKDIDALVADVSKVIGYAINLSLHDGIGMEDINGFLS